MDKYKSIIIILVAICLIMGTALATYLSIGNQHTEIVQVANNTTANTTVTAEHINSDPSNNVQKEDSSNNGQTEDSADKGNDNNMPEETRKIYAARQKAADDGIPMYEYIHSPELVEKYQAMV